MRVVVDHFDVEFQQSYGYAIGKCREGVLELMALRVCDAYQNIGVGSDILRFIADWCIDTGVQRIELYDMSTRYNAAHNIYLRAGFAYANPVGRDMYATATTVHEALKAQPPDEPKRFGASARTDLRTDTLQTIRWG